MQEIMTESHVVAALQDKRAGVLGIIVDLERRGIGKHVNNALIRQATEMVEKIVKGRAVFWRIRV